MKSFPFRELSCKLELDFYGFMRAGGFLCMDFAMPALLSERTYEVFPGYTGWPPPSDRFPGARDLAPAVSDPPGLARAKLLLSRSRSLMFGRIADSAWPEFPETLEAAIREALEDLPGEGPGVEGDGDAGSSGDGRLRCTVLAALNAFASRFVGIWDSRMRFDSCASALELVPVLPGMKDELAAALSFAGAWYVKEGRGLKVLDRFFEKGWRLVVEEGADAFLPLVAHVVRTQVSAAPRFGPGRGLGGPAGTLANGIELVRKLAVADFGCGFVLMFLSSVESKRLPPSDIRRVAAGAGSLPDRPSFRLAWQLLECWSSRTCVWDGEQGLPPEEGLELMRMVTEGPGAAVLALRDGPALPVLTSLVARWGWLASLMDREGMAIAVKAVAELRASGAAAPWAFSALFHKTAIVQPSAFRAAVIKAAAEGFFGDGPALVQAVAHALFTPAPKRPAATDFPEECDRIALRASRPGAPLGVRLAAGMLDCEFESQEGGEHEKAFKALAALCPEGPVADGALSPAGGGKPAQPPEADPWRLSLYAYSAALVAAAWGFPGRRLDGDNTGIPALLRLLPKRAFEDPAFLDKMLPGAAHAPSVGRGMDQMGPLSLLFSSDPVFDAGFPQTEQVMGNAACAALMAAICGDPDVQGFIPLAELAFRCLERTLPPKIRSWLVVAITMNLGRLGLVDRMEAFFLDNALMLVREPAEGYRCEWDDWEGLRGDPARRVSLPARARDFLTGKRPFPGPGGLWFDLLGDLPGGGGMEGGGPEGEGAEGGGPGGVGPEGASGGDHAPGSGPAPSRLDVGAAADALRTAAERILRQRQESVARKEHSGPVAEAGGECAGQKAPAGGPRAARSGGSKEETVGESQEEASDASGDGGRTAGPGAAEGGPGSGAGGPGDDYSVRGYVDWLCRYYSDFLSMPGSVAAAADAPERVWKEGGWDPLAPEPGDGWRVYPVWIAHEGIFHSMSFYLAECGRYSRALEFLLRDTNMTYQQDVKNGVLDKIIAGLSREGGLDDAMPSLVRLETLAGYARKTSILVRCLKAQKDLVDSALAPLISQKLGQSARSGRPAAPAASKKPKPGQQGKGGGKGRRGGRRR
ncbi:MAG: hypothetical protein LBQ12_11890 [Deltaproteobacteria bacterium]|jgi:hypothetical protein|nr:hypothetical protein [Deltaproteobacteria bacterium]